MDGISSMTIFWIVFLVAVVLFAYNGVVQVPQSKVLLVERLGKYTKTLRLPTWVLGLMRKTLADTA